MQLGHLPRAAAAVYFHPGKVSLVAVVHANVTPPAYLQCRQHMLVQALSQHTTSLAPPSVQQVEMTSRLCRM